MHKQSKYDFIDCARAIAAFLVVISHVQQLLIDRPLTPGLLHRALSFATTQGSNAVAVFFVISGYWIIRSVVNSGDGFSLKKYLLARGVRLWIVLVPALIIGGLVDWTGIGLFHSALYQGTQGAVSLTAPVADRLAPLTFLGNLAFLQDITVPALGSNGALWTLACEFWFYVYFAFAWMAIRSRNPLYIGVAALGLFILPSLPMFGLWLLGGVVYLVVDRRFKAAILGKVWIAAAAFLLFASIALSNLLNASEIVLEFGVALAFAAFMIAGILGGIHIPRVWGPLTRFGAKSSFSLYATHLPLMVFAANFFAPDRRLPGSPLTWGLVFALPWIAVLFSIGFSLFTEARTDRVRGWLQKRLGIV